MLTPLAISIGFFLLSLFGVFLWSSYGDVDRRKRWAGGLFVGIGFCGWVYFGRVFLSAF